MAGLRRGFAISCYGRRHGRNRVYGIKGLDHSSARANQRSAPVRAEQQIVLLRSLSLLYFTSPKPARPVGQNGPEGAAPCERGVPRRADADLLARGTSACLVSSIAPGRMVQGLRSGDLACPILQHDLAFPSQPRLASWRVRRRAPGKCLAGGNKTGRPTPFRIPMPTTRSRA